MYTKEDYLAEKNAMTKQERMIQERFEQMIEILILYKKEHRDKTVYITEKSINEAIQWFQKNVNSVIQTIQN